METYVPENLNLWDCKDPAFGSRDNYVGGDFNDFYIAPIGRNRDTSDSLTLSNWEVVSADLDKLIQHEESGAHTFGHWACGWYEIYLIHSSDTEALKAADSWAASLSDYPVADEEALSRLELELADEAWESYGRSEFRDIVANQIDAMLPDEGIDYDGSDVAYDIPDDKLDNLWYEISSNFSCVAEHHSDGVYFSFHEVGDISAEILSEITGLPLLPASQAWRREPYPWPGAEPSPLVPPLPVER